MKDKEIRKILISYIQTIYHEVRIYQEKSIGAAICDVMAVTDKLIGFEIKSDADNYERLERQIGFYNQYLDENYIVVGKSHLASVYDRVPDFWGIICICEDDVIPERKAKNNTGVNRRSQLSVLWKLELKNLLIKNNLPVYAQKDKEYIANKIAEQVEYELLGKQIAHELLHRNYSLFGAPDYTTYSKNEMAAHFPAADMIDMLSEENFENFTLDKWIEIYKTAKKIKEKKETVYKAAPIERTPHTITYKDIEVSLGAPWISKDIISDFVNYIIYGNEIPSSAYNRAIYEEVTGNWYIKDKTYPNTSRVAFEYGTERRNALQIIEATLNLREIKIYDGKRFNETETIAVLEKQRLINEEFSSWVWRDEDRRWLIEEAYHKMFEEYDVKSFDGSKLQFPDMSENYSLYDYQKDAVERIISTKNTLLAFDVGAGKTYIMIAAAMKMRQMGISAKNLFVVPNSIVGQWEAIFAALYPKAKVLTVEPKAFQPQMRQKILQQAKTGDYDGIIMAYSCFEMLPLSVKFITEQMQKNINELNDVIIQNQTYDAYKHDHFLKKEIEHVKKITNRLIESMYAMPDDITFDQLEINTLFVDEAHNFKNIPIHTNLKNLRGINTKGSKKCLELIQKVRCVQRQNDGGGVVFATGTPLCNSISDAYTMQLYLQYDDMKKRRLDVFDNWVKTFAKPEQTCEIDVTASNFRIVTRFSRFHNLPELSKMFSGISVFHSMDDDDDRPICSQYSDVIIKRNDALSKYMQKINKRTEQIRSGKIDKSYDNMLKVSTDGRKAALDLTLVGEKQEYDNTSKIVNCIEKVFEVYHNHPGTSQLVFCDYSTPKTNQFNVYQEIKNGLIKKGIPEHEIAFIHSFKSESTRLKLFKEVNEAKIRVLIGSTFKLGIGANVQTKLKAIHHLDVPWRPADMIQREGRILRKGNENDKIKIFRYITEGSFDSYSWQILETKQKFISQFLKGSTYERSASDLDNNVLSYAEVKALALANPVMKKLAEKENELKTLQILRNEEVASRKKLTEQSEAIKTKIIEHKERVEKTKAAAEYIKTIDKQQLSAKLKTYRAQFENLFVPTAKTSGRLFSLFGFEIYLPEKQSIEKPYFLVSQSGIQYIVEMGEKTTGNLRRLYNFLVRLEKTVEKEEKTYQKLIKNLDDIESALKIPEKYYEPLQKCKKERDALMKKAKKNTIIS